MEAWAEMTQAFWERQLPGPNIDKLSETELSF